MAGIAPHGHDAVVFFPGELRAQQRRVFQQQPGENGDGEAQVRRAYRRSPGFEVPVVGFRQQVPDAGVNEADPGGQLPSVTVAVEAAREKDVQELAVVLLEAPLGRTDPPGDVEGFRDERREPFHQHAGDERHEHQVHVRVEGADPRTKGFAVEPGRILEIREEVAQGLRGIAQDLAVFLDAGADEPVQLSRIHRGKLLHDRVQFRVANGGVTNIVVRQRFVDKARLCVAFGIGGRRR